MNHTLRPRGIPFVNTTYFDWYATTPELFGWQDLYDDCGGANDICNKYHTITIMVSTNYSYPHCEVSGPAAVAAGTSTFNERFIRIPHIQAADYGIAPPTKSKLSIHDAVIAQDPYIDGVYIHDPSLWELHNPEVGSYYRDYLAAVNPSYPAVYDGCYVLLVHEPGVNAEYPDGLVEGWIFYKGTMVKPVAGPGGL